MLLNYVASNPQEVCNYLCSLIEKLKPNEDADGGMTYDHEQQQRNYHEEWWAWLQGSPVQLSELVFRLFLKIQLYVIELVKCDSGFSTRISERVPENRIRMIF